ncbi:hypothetical protein EKO04_007322 [Ascochyta lentis]|uniref:Uncharacterized protein n=1 Tax=Ascochyta lentis TaxID=205686 RepID=A0A8H7J2I4_9PLEO|nr:hypothetical protein EKO04_007322 [Ascochyta lentis]
MYVIIRLIEALVKLSVLLDRPVDMTEEITVTVFLEAEPNTHIEMGHESCPLRIVRDNASLGGLKIRGLYHDQEANEHYSHDEKRHDLPKRGNIVPKLPGGPLILTPLAYPKSGVLYTGPRSTTPKKVYDFKDKKLGTTSVKKFTDYKNKPTTEYATEHIVELQTHGMFMVFATGKDKTLDPFFRNKYVKLTSGTTTLPIDPGDQPAH